jgi:Domain of unknown function (DUF4365)
MAGDGSGDFLDFAPLTSNAAKARFGVAYLRAVCSQAGVAFVESSVDEDLMAFDGLIGFADVDVRVQVKCTGQFKIASSRTASWPADEHWWRKWRRAKNPVYFVLVVMDPDIQPGWLDHRSDGTLHRAAAFWARVDCAPAAASVVVPKDQRLTADTLQLWYTETLSGYGNEG